MSNAQLKEIYFTSGYRKKKSRANLGASSSGVQKSASQQEIAYQPEEIKEEEYEEPAQADQTAAPETKPAVRQVEEVHTEESKD